MKRTTRRFAVLTLALVLLSFVNISLPQPVRSASRILSVPIYKQHLIEGETSSQWCWAASSIMVLNYFGIRLPTTSPQGGGYPTQQCTFVRDVTQFRYCVNTTGDIYDVKYGLNIWGLLANADLGWWSYTGVRSQINLGRPMIAAWTWGLSGTGHMVVIKGYEDYSSTTSDGYVWFNDPNHSNPTHYKWKHSELKYGHEEYDYTNAWVATVRDIRP